MATGGTKETGPWSGPGVFPSVTYIVPFKAHIILKVEKQQQKMTNTSESTPYATVLSASDTSSQWVITHDRGEEINLGG